MIASLHISLVLHGTHKEDNGWGGGGAQPPRGEVEEDPFAVPKEMGIFQEISRCGFWDFLALTFVGCACSLWPV